MIQLHKMSAEIHILCSMTDAAHLSEMPAVGSALQLKTQSTNTNLKAEVIGYSSVERTSLLQKLTCYTGSVLAATWLR